MPRPPRPKPSDGPLPTEADAAAELARIRMSWRRGPQVIEVQSPWHLWECELCGQFLLIPAILSRRALTAYLHDHRVHCEGHKKADEDEASEHNER